MLRTILAAGLLAMSAAQPAFAQDAMMKCDDASMMKVQADVDATTDAMKKEEAMKAMEMAKESMKMSKADDCVMHLDEAMKAAKGM